MPKLDNARWETFAQKIAGGSTLEQASAACGYDGDRSNAGKLTRKPAVKARIFELQQEALEKLTRDADFDPTKLSGKDMVKRGVQMAWASGDSSKIIDAGSKVGRVDGSLDDLQPRKMADYTDEELARTVVDVFRGYDLQMGRKPRSDNEIVGGLLRYMNSGGFEGPDAAPPKLPDIPPPIEPEPPLAV